MFFIEFCIKTYYTIMGLSNPLRQFWHHLSARLSIDLGEVDITSISREYPRNDFSVFFDCCIMQFPEQVLK